MSQMMYMGVGSRGRQVPEISQSSMHSSVSLAESAYSVPGLPAAQELKRHEESVPCGRLAGCPASEEDTS